MSSIQIAGKGDLYSFVRMFQIFRPIVCTIIISTMKSLSALLIYTIIHMTACSEEPGLPEGNSGSGKPQGTGWLIPENEVLDGGPGKDGIPALSDPELVPVSEAGWIKEDRLVLGFADGQEVRAYPHQILDWHEIINDRTANHSLAVIYCPLTGTGTGWDRRINGNETTFGVSGLLYNSNIIPYDRATDSNWSQLLLKSVQGTLSGKTARTYNLVETYWKTWKKMYPGSRVVSTNTGYNRSYDLYPYGTYRVSDALLFPVNHSDSRLHAKERVLAIIEGDRAKAFRFPVLTERNNLIYDTFQGMRIVVTGSEEDNLMVAFQRILKDGTELEFQAVDNQLPVVLSDQEGNRWDVFGQAVSGPREGQALEPVTRIMGYWFSFAAFYPGIELF